MGQTHDHDDLRSRADALRRWLVEAERRGVTPGLQRLVGLREWVAQLRRLEPEARRSVWVAQPQYFWDPEDPGVELIRQVRERGVETTLITRRSTLDLHPLLPSVFPTVRIAPVFLGLLALDEERFMVAGEDTVDGERTAWFSTRRDVGAAVLDIWGRTVALSEPVLPPGTPPHLAPHDRAGGAHHPRRARCPQPDRGRAADARARRQRRLARARLTGRRGTALRALARSILTSRRQR